MSRLAPIFTAAIIAASLSSLLSAPALAVCADADLCTVDVCEERQSHVHTNTSCDAPRTCANTSANNKAELRRRLTINQRCLAARQSVSQCFSVPDQNHINQITAVEDVIQVCEDKIAQ